MTDHIYYNHQCSKCKAFYIPFRKGIVCPSCGAEENEFYDYVPEAVSSMKRNQMLFNSYMPPAWYISSLGDHVLLILFGLFEGFKTSNMDIEEFSKEFLSRKKWGDQEYLKNHIYDISLAIHKALIVRDLLKDLRNE